MASKWAFQPGYGAQTALIAVTSVPSSGVQMPVSAQGVMFTNIGAADVLCAVVAANQQATAPSSGVLALPSTSANGGFRILARTQVLDSIPGNPYLSFMTTGGSGSIELTPGFGI